MKHNYTYRFCPVCGGGLNLKRLKRDEPERLWCKGCDFVFYLDPKLVACTVVWMNGGVVLLRRAIEPQRGKWVIPGGYVDRGEVVEEAAIRETREECGIEVKIDELLGIYSYRGKAEVVVVYVAKYLKGILEAQEEAIEVDIFNRDSIPWNELAFQSTKDALNDFFKRGSYDSDK